MSATWKRAYLVRRNPRLTAAEFPGRWRQHSELGGTFPEVRARNRKLAYCLVDHAAGERIGADRTYDGIGLLWLRSPEMLNAPIVDPTAIPTMRADELKVFHQHAFADSIMLEERVLVDGPPARIGVLSFVRRPEGEALPAFRERWLGAARPRAAGLRRHVRGTTVLEPSIAFDGLDEMWFDDRDAAVAACAEAGRGAVDPADMMRFLTEICHERVS